MNDRMHDCGPVRRSFSVGGAARGDGLHLRGGNERWKSMCGKRFVNNA